MYIETYDMRFGDKPVEKLTDEEIEKEITEIEEEYGEDFGVDRYDPDYVKTDHMRLRYLKQELEKRKKDKEETDVNDKRNQESIDRQEEIEDDEDYYEYDELEDRYAQYHSDYINSDFRDKSEERGDDGTFLDYLHDKLSDAEKYERSDIYEIIRLEEKKIEEARKKEQEISALKKSQNTKQELEQVISELKENIASAQKLLSSYEELLKGGKQNDSNKGQTIREK